MILFALLALAVGQEGHFGRADATTLFFHERTLTKAAVPVPQLICKDTVPSDGCAQRRIVFAECHKAASDDWDAWTCQGHGNEAERDNPTGLELRAIGIQCAGSAVDSCSLTYTLQYNNETLARLERAKLAHLCMRLYDAGEEPFNGMRGKNMFSYGFPAFVFGLISSVAIIVVLLATGDLQFVVTRQGNDTLYSVQHARWSAERKDVETPAAEKREQ